MGYYEQRQKMNKRVREVLRILTATHQKSWPISNSWLATMTEEFAIGESHILKRLEFLAPDFNATIKNRIIYFEYPPENKEKEMKPEDEADSVLKSAMEDEPV